MLEKLTSLASRILFVGAFAAAGLAVWERLINLFGYTVLRGYLPGRLLELSAVAVLFVIALQLREIKELQKRSSAGGAGR
jgi:hypothetical protein